MIKMLKLIFIVIATATPAVLQVSVLPSPIYVSTPGGSASFHCVSLTERFNSVNWFVNGSSVEALNDSSIAEDFFAESGRGILLFSNIPEEYNGTLIQCRAQLGTQSLSSTTKMLLLQGSLSTVESLVLESDNSNIYLTWEAPFTLDITGVSPDIEGYCVDVTETSSSCTLLSECGITSTGFNYSIPLESFCSQILHIVTPVNRVGNGSRAAVSSLRNISDVLSLDAVSCTSDRGSYLYNVTMTAPVCNAEIRLEDIDTGEIILITNSSVELAESHLTFTSQQLVDGRRYIASVMASNIGGSAMFNAPIGTNGVISFATAIETTTTTSNEIVVDTQFCRDSTASGALFGFVFLTEDGGVDFNRSALLALDRNTSLNHTLPFNLYPGTYSVYVYDIEQDGTLCTGVLYPAAADELFVSSQGSYAVDMDNVLCAITSVNDLLVAECVLHNNNNNDNMVINYQMTARLDQINEVQKLYSNQSLDPSTCVTLQVERSGLYLVAIFPIIKSRGILNSMVVYSQEVMVDSMSSTETTTEFTTESTTGTFSIVMTDLLTVLVAVIVASTVIIALLIVAIIILWYCYSRRKKNKARPTSLSPLPNKPRYSKEDQKDLYSEHKPEDQLLDDETKRGLEAFCKDVVIILQTINENEFQAALTYMKSPSEKFEKAVVYPKPGMVVGMFANKKVALIRTEFDERATRYVEEAYPNASYVFGVGVCYAFDPARLELGDVLISVELMDRMNISSTGNDADIHGKSVVITRKLKEIFCSSKELTGYVVSKSERQSHAYPGLFCCDTILVNNAQLCEKYCEDNPTALGGEMEYRNLLKFVQKNHREVIVIKGVADYADKKEDKEWQFTAAMAALYYTESQLCNVILEELQTPVSGKVSPVKTLPHGRRQQIEARDRGSKNPKLKLMPYSIKTIITPEPFQRKHPIDSYYNMRAKRHGVALIINNKNFKGHHVRIGTDRDEHNIRKTCLFLGYRPLIWRDLTSIKMYDMFDNMDTYLEESDRLAKNVVKHDSFICFILSHGRSGVVYGSDGEDVQLEHIFSAASNSRKLLSKPKIFFIQASQGHSPGRLLTQPNIDRPSTQQDSTQQDAFPGIPSDVYACLATVDGNCAYRNPERGSWFCIETCQLLCKYAKRDIFPDLFMETLKLQFLNNPEYHITKEGHTYVQTPLYLGNREKFKGVHFFLAE